MTDKIAIWVGGLLLTAILADLVLNGGSASFFTLKKLNDLANYIAFWR